ncbi:MAG: CoB--CoM heterodisulfide reductase iron-sulfur subunit D [Candidatus Thorarchaeota archaeon AB_25]|nr:MAG: CoB--CoM heterodisulfide reductase iron-sulfur subunit D [Candidatus Thorarchaeota archaeon AB_25]
MLVYFAGCMATYRLPSIAEATIKILKHAGLDFKMLGEDEWCCGSVTFRTGFVDDGKVMARHNVDALKAMSATRVVTACAGCFRTLSMDYPELLGEEMPFEIIHFPSLLKELIEEGKIKFPEGEKISVTYHDPCHIGRHMGIYDDPREALEAIPQVDRREMHKSHGNASCCGAGGGVRSTNRDLARGAAEIRLKEAEETGAEVLTTACPFCTFNLREGVERSGSKIEMLDFPEFVAKLLDL